MMLQNRHASDEIKCLVCPESLKNCSLPEFNIPNAVESLLRQRQDILRDIHTHYLGSTQLICQIDKVAGATPQIQESPFTCMLGDQLA